MVVALVFAFVFVFVADCWYCYGLRSCDERA